MLLDSTIDAKVSLDEWHVTWKDKATSTHKTVELRPAPEPGTIVACKGDVLKVDRYSSNGDVVTLSRYDVVTSSRKKKKEDAAAADTTPNTPEQPRMITVSANSPRIVQEVRAQEDAAAEGDDDNENAAAEGDDDNVNDAAEGDDDNENAAAEGDDSESDDTPSESKDSAEGGDNENDSDVSDAKWIALTLPITQELRMQLPQALQSASPECKQWKGFYKFAMNIVKRFNKKLDLTRVSDPMVLQRDVYAREVFEHEIDTMPKQSALMKTWGDGGTDGVWQVIKDVLSEMFSLPGRGPKHGSKAWIKQIVKCGRATFEQMIEFPDVLKGVVRSMSGQMKEGLPEIGPDEKVPDTDYAHDPKIQYLPTGISSRSFAKHTQLPFLRRAPVRRAIVTLRNMGLMPFKTDPASMANYKAVDNFVQVIMGILVDGYFSWFNNGYFSWFNNGYFS